VFRDGCTSMKHGLLGDAKRPWVFAIAQPGAGG
jgi:hypothetical protein